MNLVPKSLSRSGHRALLKLNAGSPTILVVAGVVGLGATAVMAAKATRKIDPILDEHKKARIEIDEIHNITSIKAPEDKRNAQKAIFDLYMNTGWELTKLYGPTLIVGVGSAVAVLGGHKILRTRQISTLAAYSSLTEQFNAYRKRVADTLGEDVEKGIYEGAHGEWVKDPETGEEKLVPAWNPEAADHYLRPWFDETNVNWTRDATMNYLFLKGVQAHMNNLLAIRGHVFLNEVCDALKIPRTREGSVVGWLYDSESGDRYIDFGFMTSIDPNSVAFRNGVEKNVRLNFNPDGSIWDKI